MLEEIKDIAHDETNKAWDQTLDYSDGPRLSEKELEQGVEKVRGATVQEAITLASLHHSDLAPVLVPDRVEFQWVLDVAGEDVSLAGTIDLQEKKDSPRGGCLRDTKTTSMLKQNMAAKSAQLTMYAMAAWRMDGVIPPLAIDQLVLKKKPIVDTQTTTREIADFEVLLRRIEALYWAIEKGGFPPTNEDNWWCSERFCGYYGNQCKYTRLK